MREGQEGRRDDRRALGKELAARVKLAHAGEEHRRRLGQAGMRRFHVRDAGTGVERKPKEVNCVGVLAGACLWLTLNYLLADDLGPVRFYFNLVIGVAGAAVGVVSCLCGRMTNRCPTE